MAGDIDAVADSALMVSLLPCADIDEQAAFWTDLGLAVTYRQLRPNPYLALARGGIAVHYYGMPDWDPELSHSSCMITVTDTEPLFELFAAGLRERYGRLPVSGRPRITRPRQRANNGGLTGFSLVDPAGNWIRVSRRGRSPADDDAAAGGALTRAMANAVVLADSHGDPAQAHKILSGAVRRAVDAPVTELAPALAYLVELGRRLGDAEQERTARERLLELTPGTPADRRAVATAQAEVEELDLR
jgi:hypothetical protein